MKQRIYLALCALLLAPIALAQGVKYDNIALLDSGRPAAGANILVCSSGSSGTPCSPTASIFNDAALTSAITQPGLQADAQGNFKFYAPCNKYDIQLSGAAMTTRTMKDVQVGWCGTGAVDLTAQGAAIGTTTLIAVPASTAGQYRISWNAKVTRAATTSSTLGALTIVYTDPDAVVQTITASATIAAGTIATTSTGNTTTTVLLGMPLTVNAKAGTTITYAMAYTSSGATSMQYNLHIKVDAL